MIRSPAGFGGEDRIKRYLDYYQPSYGVMMLSAGQFSPLDLFSAGEQGAWYDPSDFSTMFQDAAGTTPVTAVEQPVGLILDKSKGLALGSELVTNGDFSNGTTGWSLTNVTVSGGVATFGSGAGFLTQNSILQVGKTYHVSFTLVTSASGNDAKFHSSQWSPEVTLSAAPISNGPGTYTLTLRAVTTDFRLDNYSGSGFQIDNISVKELPGNHASQSTAASRPVLSARVNLLTFSEQFDNAAWVSYNTTKAAGQLTLTSTVGGASQSLTMTSGVQYRFTCKIKKGTNNFAYLNIQGSSVYALAVFDVNSGSVGETKFSGAGFAVSSQTISPADADGYYTCGVTFTAGSASVAIIGFAPAATGNAFDAFGNPTGCTSGNTLLVKQADFRVTNDGVGIPAYQRVGAVTDYDTSGFPLYLRFDGTDDSLATASIDPGAVDKAQVFAGVRKIGSGMLLEASTNADNNNGSFYLYTGESGGAELGATLRGTQATKILGSSAAVPVSRVETILLDIAGASRSTEIFLRANGSVVSGTGFGAADAGTGNFLTYPLYIGRRGGSSFPFNGRLYSLILRFSAANLSDAQIASTEAWVNNVTKAY